MWEVQLDHFFALTRMEGHKMDLIGKLYVKADRFARGQTMAEYVLLVSAVAVVVYVGYQLTGTTVSTLLSSVDGKM